MLVAFIYFAKGSGSSAPVAVRGEAMPPTPTNLNGNKKYKVPISDQRAGDSLFSKAKPGQKNPFHVGLLFFIPDFAKENF